LITKLPPSSAHGDRTSFTATYLGSLRLAQEP